MATEVKHGPKPKFKARTLKQSTYRMTIVGYYTRTDQLTAAGVTEYTFHSIQFEKQRAELLGMRTAFVMWFLEEWMRRGGKWDEGVKALRGYPFGQARYDLFGVPHWPLIWRWTKSTLKLAWYVLRH